jgi:acyl carrier protein
MNRKGIEQAVCEVIGVVLGLGRQVDPSFSREEQSAWDSLKHVEIIFALEDRFEVQFAEPDMQQMDSVSRITQRIAELA